MEGLTVNVVVVPAWPPTITSTIWGPGPDPFGIAPWICVPLQLVIVAAALPIITLLLPSVLPKPPPLIVKAVPAAPLDGEIPVTMSAIPLSGVVADLLPA